MTAGVNHEPEENILKSAVGFAYILWMGNHMAGKEMSQKRKKPTKSRVLVPLDSGMVFSALRVNGLAISNWNATH